MTRAEHDRLKWLALMQVKRDEAVAALQLLYRGGERAQQTGPPAALAGAIGRALDGCLGVLVRLASLLPPEIAEAWDEGRPKP